MPEESTLAHQVTGPTQYSERFRCVGSDCEDTCCKDWNIPITRTDAERLAHLPAGPLRTLVEASIAEKPAAAGAVGDSNSNSPFAIIRLDAATQQCPMLSGEGLCRVHNEVGPEVLPHACATYPRIVHSIDGLQEAALTLSCPEAARLVLLDPDLLRTNPAELQMSSVAENAAAAENISPSSADLQRWFWPIRKSVLALVLNRNYPLWQRLFLLNVFCQRLDSIAAGELDRKILDFLIDFEVTVAAGNLRAPMETLPMDSSGQLDVVLRLAGMLLNRSLRTPRFAECVQAFTTGIGNSPTATLASLTHQYDLAHDRYYAPFFARHPYILENYLVNTIVRCQFPFGKDTMRNGTQPNFKREFSMLLGQLTLMKGLLIGVAGYHGSNFTKEHVVHTVQAASRHFEHHPEFLNMAHSLLAESGMEGARGVSILLRNVRPTVSVPLHPADYRLVAQESLN